MKRLGNLICAVGIMSIFVFGIETFAKANGSKTSMEMTTEQRQKIADGHDKMGNGMNGNSIDEGSKKK